MTPAYSISCPVYGGPAQAAKPKPPQVRSQYDNARTTPENSRNWSTADYLSAKSANSSSVRRTLRIRSRYEVSNNPYLFGIVGGNADDLVSTGPTLQLNTRSDEYNTTVENLWAEWCHEVGLPEKLRTTKAAKIIDGEGFLILKTVEDLEHPVKLYPCDVEADQVTSPAPTKLSDLWVDGLTLHPITGQPTAYHVMRSHPGDFFFPGLSPLETDKVSARHVIHWFHKFRPGQVRGVPVFTSSLDLFGELRAFRKAVLANAQTAASLTGVVEQDMTPADDEEEDGVDKEFKPFKRIPVERNMLTFLPAKTKLSAFDGKQPHTTYEMFQQVCLGEAIRPLAYPLNLALGTSQKFNFSSAKLDHINYRSSLTIERHECSRVVLNRLFAAWYEEAVLSGAVRPWDGLKVPPHEWHWPGYESIDPTADVSADAAAIAAGLLTLREFWARRGKDWRVVLQQQKDEADELSKMGLAFGDVVKRAVTETSDANAEEHANAA